MPLHLRFSAVTVFSCGMLPWDSLFLTKNGHDRYAVLDMEEYRQYEKLMAMQKLMTELEKGRRSGEEQGYFSAEDVEKELGIHD